MIRSIFSCTGGYTFVELLVAVSILAVVTTPFLTLFSGSYLSINNSGRKSAAVNLCRQQVEALKSSGCATIHDNYLGDVDSSAQIEETIPGFNGFSRITSIEPFFLPCPLQHGHGYELLKIEVTVTWEQRGNEQSETIVSLLGCR